MAFRNFFRRSSTKDSEPDHALLKERDAVAREAGDTKSAPEPTPAQIETTTEGPEREPTPSTAEAEQPEPARAEHQGEDSSSASGGAEVTVGSGQTHDASDSTASVGEGSTEASDEPSDDGEMTDGGRLADGNGDEVDSGGGELGVAGDHEAAVDTETEILPDHEDGEDHTGEASIDVETDAHADLPPIVEPATSAVTNLSPPTPTPVEDTVPSWTDPPENGPDEETETFEPVFTGELDPDPAQPFVPEVHLPDPEPPIQLPDVEPIDG
ncbi:MAG: hypothetical protein AAGA99_03690 [Actinomycetota bacterium]